MTVADFTSIVNQLLPEPHAGLLNGILFGTKTTLSKDLYDQLIQTGTLHIIALSGMNITILANLISITLLRFLSRQITSVLTIVLIIGFISFVGPSASVIRAGIMGTIALLAVIFGRQAWSLLTWFLAVMGMLLIVPGWISDIGFQLSIMATLGIILFGKNNKLSGFTAEVASSNARVLSFVKLRVNDPLKNGFTPSETRGSHLPKLPAVNGVQGAHFRFLNIFWSLIEDDLRVTLAAQVFTIPIILFYFHRISLISPLSNVLIGWVIQPITVLGLITVAVGSVWLPLGQVIAWVTWVPLQYLLTCIWITSMLPFASLSK